MIGNVNVLGQLSHKTAGYLTGGIQKQSHEICRQSTYTFYSYLFDKCFWSGNGE